MVKMPGSNNDEDSQTDYVSSDCERGNTSDEPDSDSSSEMSESECDRMREICLKRLNDLEGQFLKLRELLYVERINQIDIQLSEVRGGRSQEYLGPLQSLHDTMNARKEVAEILKNFRLQNIQHKFDSEVQAAKQHFESEKQLALDSLNEELLEKIRRLEEDSHNVDINWADYGLNARSNISKVRGPGRKKAISVTGPFVVYMLKDEEILDDWTTIRKAMATKRTASVTT